MLTQAIVHYWFNYDPLTGELIWRHNSGTMYAGWRAGSNLGEGRYVNVRGTLYKESKVIWLWMTGVWPSFIIDHEDGDWFNNKWANLRPATMSQNNANRRNNVTGKLKWTSLTPAGRWRAQVHWKGKRYSTATYDTEQEAHDAAWLLAQKLHGNFATRR